MTLKDDLERMCAEDATASPGPWEYGGTWLDRPYARGSQVLAHFSDYTEEDASLPPVPGNANGRFCASARLDRPALAEMVKMIEARFRNYVCAFVEAGGEAPRTTTGSLPTGGDWRAYVEGEMEWCWAEAKRRAGGR